MEWSGYSTTCTSAESFTDFDPAEESTQQRDRDDYGVLVLDHCVSHDYAEQFGPEELVEVMGGSLSAQPELGEPVEITGYPSGRQTYVGPHPESHAYRLWQHDLPSLDLAQGDADSPVVRVYGWR
jgi:hypothetical protein